MSVRIIQGDCREALKALADGSVHVCVTSPPYYGLRDYGTAKWEGGEPDCDHVAPNRQGETGQRSDRTFTANNPYRVKCGKCGAIRTDSQIGLEQSPDEYVAEMVAVFREVKRVLKQDALLVLNLGDSYARNPAKGGSGPNGKHDFIPDYGNARRILSETKGSSDGGVGRGDRAPIRNQGDGLKEKDLIGIPWRVAFALQADGWYLRAALPWIKRSCMPESVTDRPTSAVEYVFLLAKQQRYFWDAEAVMQAGSVAAGTRAAKGSNVRSDLKDVNGRPPEYWEYTGRRNFRNSDLFFESVDGPHGLILDAAGNPIALDVNPTPYAEAHFATFSPNLVAPLIKASTSDKGCCATCGAPWTRQTERSVTMTSGSGKAGRKPSGKGAGGAQTDSGDYDIRMGPVVSSTTIGWQPNCQCNAPVIPCTVLDPFSGAFTTAMVADRLRRHAIGIELSQEYCEIAQRRLIQDAGMFADLNMTGAP